jgi:uncharacterized protein with LGFP repeats
VIRLRSLLTAVVVALLLTAGLLVGSVSGSAPVSTAAAADLSRFDPANIISDAVFYDATSMDEASIQQFLDIKNSNCTDGTYKCIRNYTATNTYIAPNSFCTGAYAAGTNEKASRIIFKVAQACGINPQVLLVTLQKEQGSITTFNPTESDYRIAMGYGCPDTAACDTTYYGFRNQIYNAAKQFKRYAANPSNYPYKPYITNYIQWHPNSGCGGSYVQLVNQATAGLYNYTPYRPNDAALAAGYGSGNSCSSYGNRNFFAYFTDWFGSTQSSATVAASAIRDEYTDLGGPEGILGDEVGGIHCGMRDFGCFQQYDHARIYYSASTGAHYVTGAMYAKWAEMGLQTSTIGYPAANPVCGLVDSGCYQQFQKARIYDSASTDPMWITGAIYTKWSAMGRESGSLGYPTGDPFCGLRDGGCYQQFGSTRMYSSASSGAAPVSGDILAKWASMGLQTSAIGYPTAEAVCGLPDDGCYQQFQKARIYDSASTDPVWITGEVYSSWAALGRENWVGGYPTGDRICTMADGGCYQQFQRARIYYSANSPATSITGAMYNAWAALGRETWVGGYPTGERVCGLPDTGCYQQFQHARIYDSASTDPAWITGAMFTKWAQVGRENWSGGYPSANRVCGLAGGGCYQQFEHARIYYSASTPAKVMTGAFYNAWAAKGAQNGVLGYPTTDPLRTADTLAVVQTFAGGGQIVSSAGGVRTLSAEVAAAWASAGGGSNLGYPTSDPYAVTGGTRTNFDNGAITVPSGGGTATVTTY